MGTVLMLKEAYVYNTIYVVFDISNFYHLQFTNSFIFGFCYKKVQIGVYEKLNYKQNFSHFQSHISILM